MRNWFMVLMLAGSLQGGAAFAQNALGGGNVLDANPGVNRGQVNSRTTQTNYRVRNLLVTGDVPSGRGFRGDVGYGAEGDFRATLGSDDVFAFRADSAFSAPNVVRLGGTADRLRFGYELASLSYRRTAAPAAASATAPARTTAAALADQLRVDWMIATSSSQSRVDQAVQPQALATAVDREGRRLLINSSALRGINVILDQEDGPGYGGLSLLDRLELNPLTQSTEQSDDDVGKPFLSSFQMLDPGALATGIIDQSAQDSRNIVEPLQMRNDAAQETDHRKILERIAKRYAGDENVVFSLDQEILGELDDDFAQIRSQLLGTYRGQSPDGQPAPSDAASSTPIPSGRPTDVPGRGFDLERNTVPQGGMSQDDEDAEDTEEDASEEDEKKSLESFGIILRHGERIERLASENKSRFDELMRSAEERLRDGEYFWAERRFMRALRFVPGHPLATAGLGHAQLGAGLYPSASATLRSLLSHQPEMIDVQYDQSLLPNRIRLLEAVDEVRFGPQLTSTRSASGFLLAYVGHQLDDRELIDFGLAQMGLADPEDPMLSLLRTVWQADK